MAQRRRPTSRSTTPKRTTRATPRSGSKPGGLPMPKLSIGLSPAVVRSLVGIALLALGAVTLIALLLPGEGSLTDWWRNTSVPFFGTGRWLLPAVLLLSGWYVEWGPGKEDGAPWGRTLLGIALAYVGLLGLLQLVEFNEFAGGRIGRFLVGILEPLLTTPGAFVLLLGMFLAGLLIAFDMPLRALLSPATRAARAAGSTLQTKTTTTADGSSAPAASAAPAAVAAATPAAGRGRGARIPAVDAPGQTGVWGQDGGGPGIPTAVPSLSPTSSTFAPVRAAGSAGLVVGGAAAGVAGVAVGATAVTTGGAARMGPGAIAGDTGGGTGEPDAPPARPVIEWKLPPMELLEEAERPNAVTTGNADAVHVRNEEIIIKKLASFDIEARVIGRNVGPVVTQYEVQPAPHVKLSKIESLSDDLSMALAARSLRIEAPIPGKSAVGIEIPNKDFSIVPLRPILQELDFNASGTRLTFALGRDVGDRPMAVDLGKMPHLLIAGATGSGKSVMVNALITSLLCNATPDDVRMILMDLKRVELAGYKDLPHLLVPVITEPERAKAALKWAVAEMETRYRKFAGATARNIKVFNEMRVDPADRLPYIVIVIDELADLMMREGKNVEDPIVRLAQKARATGIHMVLATQRPSVNVVTGLIKANFPSPDRVRDGQPDRQPDDPRLARRGGPDRSRGHALPAQRSAASDAPPGRVRVRQGDRAGDRVLASPDRRTPVRHVDPHQRGGVDRERRRPRRRRRRPTAAGGGSRHSGVRSGLGVAPAAAPQDRLRPGGTDHRPARGAGVRGRVRWLERPGGPASRRWPRTGGGRGRRMTTRDEARRTRGDARDADRAYAAETGPTLPERLLAARERKGVDLYRAERDTKIRSRYLAALEQGDYRELPGAVYTKGFLRNYALYLGLDPEDVIRQWKRERGDASIPAEPVLAVPEAARSPQAGPHVLARAHHRRAADGRHRHLRRLHRACSWCASQSPRR